MPGIVAPCTTPFGKSLWRLSVGEPDTGIWVLSSGGDPQACMCESHASGLSGKAAKDRLDQARKHSVGAGAIHRATAHFYINASLTMHNP